MWRGGDRGLSNRASFEERKDNTTMDLSPCLPMLTVERQTEKVTNQLSPPLVDAGVSDTRELEIKYYTAFLGYSNGPVVGSHREVQRCQRGCQEQRKPCLKSSFIVMYCNV